MRYRNCSGMPWPPKYNTAEKFVVAVTKINEFVVAFGLQTSLVSPRPGWSGGQGTTHLADDAVSGRDEVAIEAERDDWQIAEQASHDDCVVQVRTRHLDGPEIRELRKKAGNSRVSFCFLTASGPDSARPSASLRWRSRQTPRTAFGLARKEKTVPRCVFFSSLCNVRGNTLQLKGYPGPNRRNCHPISDQNGKIFVKNLWKIYV